MTFVCAHVALRSALASLVPDADITYAEINRLAGVDHLTKQVGGGMGPGYRNLQVRTIIEDANFRDSATSYLIQSADLSAFLLYQSLAPSAYMRKKSGQNYFKRLDPVLCRQASPRDPQGIVRL